MLDLAAWIRAARKALMEPIPVDARPAQCRACGMRSHCGQAIRHASVDIYCINLGLARKATVD